VAILAAPNPIAAHSGGVHDTGQTSTGTWRGITATIEVGDPDTIYNSNRTAGFVAERIMVKLADGSQWFEVGWVEASWHQWGSPPQPKPEIYTYVKTTVPGTGGWMYHGLVDPGSTIGVRIEATCSSSCLTRSAVRRNTLRASARSTPGRTA
jgi:hypothetical protein